MPSPRRSGGRARDDSLQAGQPVPGLLGREGAVAGIGPGDDEDTVADAEGAQGVPY
ncbi:hypothetical protein [Streptomyces sp. NBC_00057]|uniref:hypothetical protein n=1 Tax=Streptomyces sp. NBC_00057 TaxID=2975634 RepID=UPI0032453345